MLGVGDGVADDVLKEDLEDTAGLLVDESADALDSAAACQAADGGLGDALDVVPQDLPVALGASLSESFSSFSASCGRWWGGGGGVSGECRVCGCAKLAESGCRVLEGRSKVGIADARSGLAI